MKCRNPFISLPRVTIVCLFAVTSIKNLASQELTKISIDMERKSSDHGHC